MAEIYLFFLPFQLSLSPFIIHFLPPNYFMQAAEGVLTDKYMVCIAEFFDACFQPGQEYSKDNGILSIAEEEQRMTVSVQGAQVLLSEFNDERHTPLMTASELRSYEKLRKNYRAPRDELEIFPSNS